VKKFGTILKKLLLHRLFNLAINTDI
jgi:hypothetical protein